MGRAALWPYFEPRQPICGKTEASPSSPPNKFSKACIDVLTRRLVPQSAKFFSRETLPKADPLCSAQLAAACLGEFYRCTVPQGESTLAVRSYYCRLTRGTDPEVCLLFVIILIMCFFKHHAVDEVQV